MNPQPDKTIPALYGGLIIGLISSIPFINFVNCFCCAGILLGGFLAVMFYRNNFTPDTPPFTAGDCLVVGIMAGVIGAVVESVLSIAFIAMFGNVALETLLNILKSSNVQIPDQVLEKLEETLSETTTIFSIFLNFFLAAIRNSIFGLLGGLIGYSVFKPRQQTMTPPMPPRQTS